MNGEDEKGQNGRVGHCVLHVDAEQTKGAILRPDEYTLVLVDVRNKLCAHCERGNDEIGEPDRHVDEIGEGGFLFSQRSAENEDYVGVEESC